MCGSGVLRIAPLCAARTRGSGATTGALSGSEVVRVFIGGPVICGASHTLMPAMPLARFELPQLVQAMADSSGFSRRRSPDELAVQSRGTGYGFINIVIQACRWSRQM